MPQLQYCPNFFFENRKYVPVFESVLNDFVGVVSFTPTALRWAEHQSFTEGLEAEVLRSQWQIISYCWIPNHIHLLFRTPQANLSNGMQHWLSGYANWYAKRNQWSGHLYQNRFKAFQVEDLSYFWPLSRYIHLSPRVGKKPLVRRLAVQQLPELYLQTRCATGW